MCCLLVVSCRFGRSEPCSGVATREGGKHRQRVVGIRDGESPAERLVFLASPVKNLDELKGGTLLVQGGSGELSTIWLEEELAARGVPDPSRFFGQVRETRSVGQAHWTFPLADASGY